MNRVRIVVALVSLVALAACRPSAPPPATVQGSGSYTPGLGEIMSLQQMRHAKLWFAGQNGNWLLADYEIKELKEGFDDAVTMHPILEDAPLPIKDIMPKKITVPLQDLGAAVRAQNRPM